MSVQRAALLVGIEEYKYYSPLTMSVKGDILGDDRSPGLKATLESGLGKLSFPTVTPLLGRHTAGEVQKFLSQNLREFENSGQDRESSLLLLYFTGHGAMHAFESEGNRFLFATHETEFDNPTVGLRLSWLLERCSKLKASVALIMDCCYSGAVFAGQQHLAGKTNFFIFASSAAAGGSYLTDDQGQSRFTRLLIRALLGQEPAALDRRELTTESLGKFLEAAGPKIDQQPQYYSGGQSIVLARPHAPIPVSASQEPDVAAVFEGYVAGRLNEYKDWPELTSDEFFLRINEDAHVIRGVPPAKERGAPAQQDALQYLSLWSRSSSRLAFVLGDTGTGKSYLLQRLWYDLAREWQGDHAKPGPPLVDLRLLSGARLHRDMVAQTGAGTRGERDDQRRFRAILIDALQDREGIAIFWSQFESLVSEGKILLILDGLDEMGSEGEPDAAKHHLGLIAALTLGQAKILISCRTHYLRSDQELLAAIKGLNLKEASLPLLTLNHLDQTRINVYLRARLNESDKAFWDKGVQDDHLGLTQLCNRPFLLAAVVEHFGDVVTSDQLRISQMFFLYLRTWLDRDAWRFSRFLSDFHDVFERHRGEFQPSIENEALSDLEVFEERMIARFIELLGTYMWSRSLAAIAADEIPTLVRMMYPQVPDVFVNFFDYAIRTCSFLTRDAAGSYSFINNAIRDYFAVRKFRDDIVNSYYYWDTSRERGQEAIRRIPIELGLKALSAEIVGVLADALRIDVLKALKRLKDIIEHEDERAKASPETLYYLGGNCLAIYARLNGGRVPPGRDRLDLRGRWLNGTYLSHCNLTGVDLQGSLMHGCDLSSATLTGADLHSVRLVAAKLSDADFSNVRVNGEQDAIIQPIDNFNPARSNAPETVIRIIRESQPKGSEKRQYTKHLATWADMLYIPGGVFLMGTASDRAQPYERPPRRVEVLPFYLDEKPVSNQEFAVFVKANPEWRRDAVIDRFGIPYYLCSWDAAEAPPEGKDSHPVVYLNWYAAEAYADRKS